MSNFAAKMHSAIRGTKRSVLWFFASCMVAVFASVTLTQAAFNKQLNYQGKLTNASNVAVADGTYNMEFKLYTVSSGGVAIWTETRTGADKVQVTSGLFSVMLGEVNPLTGVNFNQTLYLGVNIGGTGTPSWDGEMTPRKKLGAVPAAVEAENLGGASASQYLRSDIAATSSVTDNTNAAFTVAQLGTGNIFDVLDGATKVLTVLDGGNVGIGDATPASLFTVGSGDLFQVNSSGAIAAATGITTSGALTLSTAPTTSAGTYDLLTRNTSTGVIEKIASNTFLTANQTITLSGDVSGSGTTAITTTIGNNAVTFGKFQTISTGKLLGRSTAGTGNVEELSIGSGLSLTGGTLSATGSVDTTGNYNWTGTNTFANANGLTFKPFGTNAGETTETRFLELAANGTEYAGFKAPDSLVASVVWTLPTSDSSGCVQSDGSGHLLIASCLAGGGGGTVTSFSAGDLSPLFTTSVSTPTTTPALGFTLSNAAANTWFGNNTGSSAAPAYNAAGTLSKTDDTNVTLTLGGTPTGSLLNSVSITAGWTGQLAVGRGGTGAGTLTANGVLYGNGTSAIGATAAGTNGQILVGVTGGAPAFVSLSGDAAITNTGVLTIGANAVTYAKFQQVAASSIVGNPTGSLANAQGITLGAGLAFSGTTLVTSSIPNASLQNSSITLATGTTGTDVGWGASSVALGGTATLNIPDAGSSARGVVTTGTQTFAGVKTLSSAPIFSSVTDAAGNFLTLNTSTGLVQKRTAAEVLSDIGALSSGTSSTQTGYFSDIKIQDDTTPSNYLSITDAENLTADHILSLSVNNADRTISLSGNLTVSSAATISGTNTGDVSLAGQNYLSIAGQVITANAVDLSGTNATGTLAAARLGTFTGDVTSAGATYATTIASNAVTYAKFQQVAANSIVGNPTGALANAQAITLGSTLTFSGTTLQTVAHTGEVTSSANSFALTIDKTITPTWTGLHTFNANSLGTTQSATKGIALTNTTAAAAGAQQISPAIVWTGQGWKTSATAASQSVQFRADVLPVQGGAAPTGTWQLAQSINGGAFSNVLTVTSAGAVTATGAITGSNLSGTNTGDVTLAGQNYLSIAGQVITANAVDLSGTNVTGTLAAARFGALTGDVTSAGGTYATTIASNAVTYAKFQQVAASSIVGNPTGSLANAQGITLGATLAFSGTSLQTAAHTGEVTSSANSFALTIDKTIAPTWTGLHTFNANSLGTTQSATKGIALTNTTAAALGAQQISPAVVWTGQGWKTNATAGSQSVQFRADVFPVQGTTNPSGTWQLAQSVNGGAYSNVLTVTSAGAVTATGTISGSNLSGTNSGDVTLAGENYLSIAGQVITANAVNLSGTNVTGTLAAARFGALTGDVTSAGGTYATTIASNAVTYAKFQQVAASSIVGNPTGSLANAQGITLGAGLAFSGTSLVTSNIPNSSLQNSTIALVLGTSGTDANVTGSPASLGGTLTLNIPDAAATARGLVTTGSQTIAGIKTFSTSIVVGSIPFINNGTGSLSLGAATPAVTGSFFAGTLAGNNADYASNSVFIGNDAGDGALYGAESVYIGHGAGAGVTYNAYNTYIGKDAGSSAYGDSGLFLGVGAGSGSGTNYGIILGYNAGASSSGDYQTIIGYGAGSGAYNAASVNFIGASAGVSAANANDSNFIGSSAGNGAANAAYSNLIGYHAGMTFVGNSIGSNNIVIGTNVSLPNAVTDSINIGGIIFGSGAYSTTSGDPSIDAVSTGKIGIGIVSPSYRLDVLDANTGQTANNRVFNVSNNGADFDTTAGALSSYGGYFSSTSTRSAGANALTNVGLYTEASGAQNNYGLIVGSGSVGIGTSTPIDPLHVNGAFRISGSASARTALASSVTYDYVSSGSYARIESWGGNSSTRGGLVFRQSASDGTLGQEPFSIDSAGKTTLGTGTTATQLVVNGGNASSTAGQLLLTNGSGQALYTGVGNGGGFMYITNQDLTYWANGVGNINLTASGGSINLTGNLLPATSDTVALGSTTKMFSDLFLASGSVINWNNGDVTLTHSADTLTVAGGTLVTPTLTVSGLTSGRVPYVTTGGQLTDTGAFTWNNSTNQLSLSNGATGANEFIYMGSSTTSGLSIQSADINTNAFMVLGDTSSGGTISFGGTASVDFLPTITLKPNNTTFPYGMMLVQTADIGTVPAYNIDARQAAGALATQPLFGVQSYGGTAAFQINADSTTWFNAGILPRTSDGAALGSTSKMWSDLFLANGGVINWNNGDVSLTHSADTLTLSGGALAATGDVTIGNSSANQSFAVKALGNASLKFNVGGSDIFAYEHTSNGLQIYSYTSPTPGYRFSIGYQGNVTIDPDPAFSGAALTITRGTFSIPQLIVNNTSSPQASINFRNSVDTAGYLEYDSTAMGIWTGNVRRVLVDSTGFYPNTNDGLPLGLATKSFSDLFLASGGVVNFNNGDVTLTHSADALTVGGGNLIVSNLDADLTAPTTTGTTKMVITDSNGQLSFTNIPAGGSTTLNSILAATATNTIDNAAYSQEWQWNSLTTGTGMKLSSTSVSSGTLLDLTVNSTAAASNTQKALNISMTGANGTSQTTYASYISNAHSGAGSVNVGMYLSAAGGAVANYALVVPSAGGRVGIGTTTPGYLLQVEENSTGFAPAIGITNTDTSTTSYAQIAFQGSGRTFGVGVGNSTETTNSLANKFFVYDATTNAVRFTIDTNGSVGIGDSTPNSLFTVGANNDAFQINSLGQITAGSITSTFGSINIGANNFTTTGTVFGNTIDRSTAGILAVGSTATSVALCASTACDTINIGTNADADSIVLGDTSYLDTTTLNGKLDAKFALTAQTASMKVGSFTNAGATFNTTSAAIAQYTGYFANTATRSAGTNALTNVALYATASGAQNNYAAIFDQGNVGIGTTTPTDKFQIYSSANTADLLKVQESGAINTNNNTYGVTIMGKNTYLSANYPVLAIGDTSQATAYGIALEAKNGVYNIPTIQLGFSGSGGALDMWNYRSWQPDSTYGMKFTTKAAGNAATDRITIGGNADTVDVLFKNSNVGIGATTASSKLDITTNSLGTTQTTTSGLALVNTTAAGSGAQQISPAIRWRGQGWKTDATAASQAVDIRSYLVPVQGAASPSGYLTFESAVNGGSFSNIFTVDSSGKIGVGGITAPTSALSVNGTGYVSGWFGISATSQYNSSDFTIGDATDQDLWMAFRGKKADNTEIRLVMGTQGNVGVGNDNAFIGTATGDKLQFRTNNTGRLTILGGGNVGIGNGNPSYQLHVGDGTIAGIIARFQNSTGTCDINPTTTSLSCSSDMRLKKNITKLDSEDEAFTLNTDLNVQEDTILSKVLAITPVTYNWNSENDGDPKHVGFIAQEVEQVFPDLVSTDDQGKKSLNYIGLVPYTIKAIQEMNVRVAALPEFEDQTMAQKVADFLRGIAERGEAVISSIKTQRVHTEELCVGSEGDEVCVTKDQLQNLLNNSSASAGGSPTAPEQTPTGDQGTDTGTTDTTATDTTGTGDSGTADTSTDTGTAGTTSTDTTSADTASTPAADTGSSSDTSSI